VVGILEVGAEEGKAIDCAELRVLGTHSINSRLLSCLPHILLSLRVLPSYMRTHTGSQENDLLKTLKDSPKDASAKSELATVQAAIDALTDFTDVYARAKPIDKITIVRSYQRQGTFLLIPLSLNCGFS
jgi:magnesium-transporting ATPase (P-type)